MRTRRLPLEMSAELRLAVDCCRNSFASCDRRAPSEMEAVDWTHFLRLNRFQLIEGLAWNSLSLHPSAIPGDVRRELAEAASQIAAQNLRMLSEYRMVQHIFQDAKLPLLFLKGVPLGTLAYGNPALKSAIDIDLLIDPVDLERAASLLSDLAYRTVIPPGTTEHGLHRRHKRFKESVWVNETSPPTQIDLHTRTADNGRLIPTIDVHSPSQGVNIGYGITLPTLAADQQFAYLAVHGASSAWFRLKWISDFAALLHSKDEAELTRLYSRSQQLGAGRAAGLALLLADSLFGTLADAAELRSILLGDRATRSLCRASLSLVAGEPVEPTDRLGGTLPIHWTQFLMKPGFAYKLTELSGQLGRVTAVGLT